MEGTLNQPCRVQEEGPTGRKLLLPGNNRPDVSGPECTRRIRIG